MKAVAGFFGKEFLREVDENEFMANIKNIRAKLNNDRAVLRAIHFFNDNRRAHEEVKALKNDDFRDIISRHSYYASFSTTTGEERNITWESTNHYFINQAVPPKDVEVVGGKTGTTSEAGACLVLLSKNKYGNPYVTVIMKEPDKDSLYQEMNQLLGKINEK